MLTFTRDDNNTYIVTANEMFIGRLYKKHGVWCLVNSKFNAIVPYETSLELTESELENDYDTWLTYKE